MTTVVSAQMENELNHMGNREFRHSLGTKLKSLADEGGLHGLFTTVGGDAVETIPAVGVSVGDTVIVTVNTVGATPRVIVTAIAAADSITVTLAGDPSNDHVLNWKAFLA